MNTQARAEAAAAEEEEKEEEEEGCTRWTGLVCRYRSTQIAGKACR
jgi:hypothetical protein